MAAAPLAPLFLAHARGAAERLAALPTLEGLLATLLSAGRASWPAVELEPERYMAHLARQVADERDPVKSLIALHSADLYLACACAAGDPRALAAFERSFMAEVPAFVARIDPSHEFADEVAQTLRHKLLLATDDAPPKIADFAGTGPLGGWLRVAAVRTARNLVRSRKAGPPMESRGAERELPVRAATDSPELDYLRARHGAEFRSAFQESLVALSPKDRNVLCLYFIDGTSSNAIAALYRVHAATVRRWIEGLRKTILDDTCRRLTERLHLSASEIDSIARLVQSQLDLNISTFLRRPETRGPTS